MDAVRQEISQRDTSLVFHVGDVSYGDGKGKVWHAFMEEISTFATSTPYMVGVGAPLSSDSLDQGLSNITVKLIKRLCECRKP